MTLNPYLTFNGNCEEALNFYADVLDGEIKMLMRFEETPPDAFKVPPAAKQLIMHATLVCKGNTILASDTIDEEVNGDNISLSIGAEDNEEGIAIFNSLQEGGHVIMPFSDVFWGGKFGMLTDKFGIKWMVSGPH